MQKHIQSGEALRHEVRQHLKAYNSKYLEIQDDLEIVFDERDANGKLLGGLVCTIVGQWLEIDYLWVETSQRYKGLGSRLLIEAEAEAVKRGCKYAVLHTYSFQARPFYEKHGYHLAFVQKHYPIVNVKYHMTKTL